MQTYKQQFIQFAIDSGALRFGIFTLKSGRTSPYFFNAGLFNSGRRLKKLGQFYANALQQSGLDYDMLFGPAYKGIPLACTIAIALASEHGLDVPFAFNRKEKKDHGEGGQIVGADLAGKVLIVDDVITAGTAVNESVVLINQAGAAPCGVLIALDRQEITNTGKSALSEIRQRYNMPVIAIATMEDVIAFLESSGKFTEELASILEYRKQFAKS